MKNTAMTLGVLFSLFFLTNVSAAQTVQTDLAQAIVAEINVLRINPPAYAKLLRVRLEGFKEKTYFDPRTKDQISTKEGAAAVNEAISILEKLPPLKSYSFSNDLAGIARLQSSDLSKSGLCGHKGSDGSSPETRFRRFGDSPEMSEIIFCHLREKSPADVREMAREIVINWLVDDGFPSRGHRVRLISPTLRMIGIAPDGAGNRMRVVAVLADTFYASKAGMKSF